uniref:Metallo-beta-lactamase domain-containing protein n=1 Tax=Gopherus agassizii TaxID=38772 RepID=A0A452GNR7_9SAUR
MSMDITFLGTGSAYPSPTRGASALVVRSEGECWLFDCGEGTQTQFMKSHLKAEKKIFIDGYSTTSLGNPFQCFTTLLVKECFLLSNLDLTHCNLRPLLLVLSSATTAPIKSLLTLLLTLQLDPVENSYMLVNNQQFVMKAFRLFHRIPSFGFLVEEKQRTGKLNAQKLKDLGVQPGPIYGKLKNGVTVVLENGVTISPSDVLDEPIPGRKICILGDCSGVVGDGAMKLCYEADLLVHEATLDDTQVDKAKEHGHSTPKMAAEFAKLCKVKKLVLTHFSQRYKPAGQVGEGDIDVTELKRQAESALNGQGVILAEDFLTIEIPVKKQK